MSQGEPNLIDFSQESDTIPIYSIAKKVTSFVDIGRNESIDNIFSNISNQINSYDDPFDPFERVLKESQVKSARKSLSRVSVSFQCECLDDPKFRNTTNNSLQFLDESFEDLMSIKPMWIDVDADTDIDNDLEMLKIPILEKLDVTNTPSLIEETTTMSTETLISDEDHLQCNRDAKVKQISDSLEALKEKIKSQKQNADKKDVTTLIKNLKQIILEHSDEKKLAADDLLESLESLLNKSESLPFNNMKNSMSEHEKDENSTIEDQGDETEGNIVIMKSPPQHIVEQIDKILSEQNNSPQLSEKTSKRKSNSTYVFVMNTPKRLIRQATEILDRRQRSMQSDNSDEQKPHRRRSSSVTGSENIKSLLASNTNFKTSVRPTSHYRKSISTTPVVKSAESKMKLLHEKDDVDLSKTRTSYRRSVNGVTKGSKNMPSVNMKSDKNLVKLRLKSNEINPRSSGPIKATIPVIKVAPILVTSSENLLTSNSKAITTAPVTQNVQKQKKSILNASAASAKSLTSTESLSQVISPRNMAKSRTRCSYLSIPSSSKLGNDRMSHRKSLSTENQPSKVESIHDTNSTRTRVKSIKFQDYSNTAGKLAPINVGLQTLKQRKMQVQRNKENNPIPYGSKNVCVTSEK